MDDGAAIPGTPTGPWAAWVDDATADSAKPDAHRPRSDGRVTLAEYLERFAHTLAECLHEADLADWMAGVNRSALDVERAYGRPSVWSDAGTPVFHPHTLAWMVEQSLDGGPVGWARPSGEANPWFTVRTESVIVPTTAGLRAVVGNENYRWRALDRATMVECF